MDSSCDKGIDSISRIFNAANQPQPSLGLTSSVRAYQRFLPNSCTLVLNFL